MSDVLFLSNEEWRNALYKLIRRCEYPNKNVQKNVTTVSVYTTWVSRCVICTTKDNEIKYTDGAAYSSE
jgi:hypothetical protein